MLGEILQPKTPRDLLVWNLRKLQLKFLLKNPLEAHGTYYDREEAIKLFFKAGFRQVIVQGLRQPTLIEPGVFSLVAATK